MAKKPKKPKPGRELEELIARLEKLLAGKGVEIKSPDSIPDKDTGAPREIDISLRGKVGSSPILVIVECRDRGRTQGVEWIEQLFAKGVAVGASRIVAVSQTGFSKNAFKKAKTHGIELRTLTALSASIISKWFPFSGLAFTQRRLTTKRWRFAISTEPISDATDAGPDHAPLIESGLTTEDACLRIGSNGELFSPNQLFAHASDRLHAQLEEERPSNLGLPTPSPSTPTSGTLNVVDHGVELRAPDMQLVFRDQVLYVRHLELLIEVTTTFSMLSVGEGQGYSTAGHTDPHIARYPLKHDATVLIGNIELLLFPAEQRFVLATSADDGEVVELVSASLNTPSFDPLPR